MLQEPARAPLISAQQEPQSKGPAQEILLCLHSLDSRSPKMPTNASPGSGATIPIITAVSPSSGPPGTAVVLTGSGFTNATVIDFGTVQASNVDVISDTQIKAIVPLGPGGSVDVTVT